MGSARVCCLLGSISGFWISSEPARNVAGTLRRAVRLRREPTEFASNHKRVSPVSTSYAQRMMQAMPSAYRAEALRVVFGAERRSRAKHWLVIVFCGSVLAVAIGCGQPAAQPKNSAQGGAKGSTSGASKAKSRDEVIRQMREAQQNAPQAVAAPPPADVLKKLVGVWRADARYRDGKWEDWRRVGMGEDVAFSADGTVRVYMLTVELSGVYETSPGDGCVDVLATVGDKNKYTYGFSVAFENDMLLMTDWQRMDFVKERVIENIEDGKAKNGLKRFYRVKEFRVAE